eukprot:12442182-Alexandrium_andersonii.AAC.1
MKPLHTAPSGLKRCFAFVVALLPLAECPEPGGVYEAGMSLANMGRPPHQHSAQDWPGVIT